MSSSCEVTKNDSAWERLFDQYNILERIQRNGYFEMTAAQINQFREARLMTKFDHKINLPKLFSEHHLAILPITRGSYIISNFAAYKEFEQLDGEITRASLPDHIQSINHEKISSEALAINCAYGANILADFLQDEALMPAISGRMGSGTFSFHIHNTSTRSNVSVNVANSQIEIDGGYEGIRQLALIEAKNFISDDFLIRQLYYPYRLWAHQVTKKVTPVFLVYSNGIYHLYEYAFQEQGHYNSLVLVKQKNYSIEAVEIGLDDIVEVLDRVKIVEEPRVSFPQADNFKRVINLCELLSQETMTKDDITLNYAFDPRQTNYYTDAGRYLGFIEKIAENNEIWFSLTDKGQKVLRSKYKVRQLKFAEAILGHRVFNEALRLYLRRSQMPSRSELVDIMKRSNLHQIGAESTFQRRASTVASWINWILDLQRR